MTTEVLLVLIGSLVSVLLGLLAWIGNSMVEQLRKIAGSVNRIENDLSVLSNDHYNFKDSIKEDISELKNRVHDLEN